MKIQVLFFAAARDAAGRETDTIDVPSQSSVRQVLDALWQRHPGLAPLRETLRVAVNEDFVAADHVVGEGDRLALLPPMSGG